MIAPGDCLPDVTSDLEFEGLIDSVEIFRDTWGVPHIRAQNLHDAFFGQGFATAQDRLWHMDYDRHRALGRWAEWAGRDGLEEDRLMRAFGVESASRADLTVTSEAGVAMLEAYTAGVNAFISSTRTLPIEYDLLDDVPDQWEPWHCLAVYKVRNMLMGTFEMKLWRARVSLALGAERATELFRGYPEHGLVSVPPGEVFGSLSGLSEEGLEALDSITATMNWLQEFDSGSNAWVISGERSATGLPIVAGDSHRALDTPNVYYQTHVTCPEFRCSGYAVPGVPGMPHFSHTEHVGWGMTHGFGDYQDLFIERFRTVDDRLEYEYRDEWIAAEVREETLEVRGAEAETLEVVRTRHGPVVAGAPREGHGLTVCHTGTMSGTPWVNTVLGLLLADSADAAEASLEDWTEPVNNFVYADTSGEFGYRYRGRIPVRNRTNGWVPVPGWTGDHEWEGQIPFTELPHARNPDAGFAVTCNNAPTTSDYPHYLNTFFAPDSRARRITTRLAELAPGTADVPDMAAIHADKTSLPALTLLRHLRDARSELPLVQSALELLRAWDGAMDRDSAAALIYSGVRTLLVRKTVERSLGAMADAALGAASGIGRGAATHVGMLYAATVEAMEAGDDCLVLAGESWESLLLTALQDAVADLVERLGDDIASWRWGALHRTHPRHPLSRMFSDHADLLDPPGIEVHGDGDTPLAGAYSVVSPFTQILMSVNRYIHDPSDWRRSRWIVPLGASGHPASSHYCDQAEQWANVQTVPQLWDWGDIEAAAESRQSLSPTKT